MGEEPPVAPRGDGMPAWNHRVSLLDSSHLEEELWASRLTCLEVLNYTGGLLEFSILFWEEEMEAFLQDISAVRAECLCLGLGLGGNASPGRHSGRDGGLGSREWEGDCTLTAPGWVGRMPGEEEFLVPGRVCISSL